MAETLVVGTLVVGTPVVGTPVVSVGALPLEEPQGEWPPASLPGRIQERATSQGEGRSAGYH